MSEEPEDATTSLGDGFVAVGSRPRFPEIPRWVSVANVPDVRLPAIPRLSCRRATGPISGRWPPGRERLGRSRLVGAIRAHRGR